MLRSLRRCPTRGAPNKLLAQRHRLDLRDQLRLRDSDLLMRTAVDALRNGSAALQSPFSIASMNTPMISSLSSSTLSTGRGRSTQMIQRR
jgi:hypothetical protein